MHHETEATDGPVSAGGRPVPVGAPWHRAPAGLAALSALVVVTATAASLLEEVGRSVGPDQPADRTNILAAAAPPSAITGGSGAAAAATLGLDELYRRPVGPRGLEFSERARQLAGKQVRLTGYMVRQSTPIPYTFLLSPAAMVLHEREYGLCEDLPPNTVHVFLPRTSSPIPPRVRGLVEIEGLLELGPREEADGRISNVRLQVPRSLPGEPAGPRPAALAVTTSGPGPFRPGGTNPPVTAVQETPRKQP